MRTRDVHRYLGRSLSLSMIISKEYLLKEKRSWYNLITWKINSGTFWIDPFKLFAREYVDVSNIRDDAGNALTRAKRIIYLFICHVYMYKHMCVLCTWAACKFATRRCRLWYWRSMPSPTLHLDADVNGVHCRLTSTLLIYSNTRNVAFMAEN